MKDTREIMEETEETQEDITNRLIAQAEAHVAMKAEQHGTALSRLLERYDSDTL